MKTEPEKPEGVRMDTSLTLQKLEDEFVVSYTVGPKPFFPKQPRNYPRIPPRKLRR